LIGSLYRVSIAVINLRREYTELISDLVQ
jgi:hypothetical protein